MKFLFTEIKKETNTKEVINSYCLYCLHIIYGKNTNKDTNNQLEVKNEDENSQINNKEVNAQIVIVKENTYTNSPMMKDESIQSLETYTDSYHIGQCQHNTHFD